MVFLCPSMDHLWPQPLRVSPLWYKSLSSKGSQGYPCPQLQYLRNGLPCCGLSMAAVPGREPSTMECLLSRIYLRPCPQQTLFVPPITCPQGHLPMSFMPLMAAAFSQASDLGCEVLSWRAAVLDTWWCSPCLHLFESWLDLTITGQLVADSHPA